MRVVEVMENKRILFNFASRSRPERCESTALNIFTNCLSDNYRILFKFDDDDPRISDYKGMFSGIVNSIPIYGTSRDKIHAINRDISAEGWDILVNMSDDIVWTVKGFDNLIRQHCGPDDFVLFPEPYAESQVVKGKNEQISVVSIMGIDYYKRDGYVYYPEYKRTHCDNEATEVARLRGRLKVIDTPIFYHEHPAAGYPVNDDQYKLEKQTWAHDSDLYKRRKEAGFPK